LCDHYAQKDKRIKIIHNKINQGSSLARKTGLDASSGIYIQFVDSDDWIEKDMLECLYSAAVSGNHDVLWLDFYGFDDNYCGQIINADNKTEILKRIFDYENCAAAVIWAKFIKKTILVNIQFPVAMQWEDLVLSTQLIALSKNMTHLPKAFYHHRKNLDSISVSKARKQKGLAEIISNLSLAIEYCRSYFGAEFIKLEPELSACVNRFKFESMFFDELRETNLLFTFYPESNKNIFQKAWKKSFLRKLALFACVRKFPGIYMLFNCVRSLSRLFRLKEGFF
jgi:glycosyltransferase involved in cell wall biosynthesis